MGDFSKRLLRPGDDKPTLVLLNCVVRFNADHGTPETLGKSYVSGSKGRNAVLDWYKSLGASDDEMVYNISLEVPEFEHKDMPKSPNNYHRDFDVDISTDPMFYNFVPGCAFDKHVQDDETIKFEFTIPARAIKKASESSLYIPIYVRFKGVVDKDVTISPETFIRLASSQK